MDTKNRKSGTWAGYALAGSLLLGAALPALRAESPFPPFNDPSTRNTIDGKVIWVDLFTADVKSATEFYTKTFGWTSEEIKIREVRYILMRNYGRPVAGLVNRQRVRGENAEGLWVAYLSVESISL